MSKFPKRSDVFSGTVERCYGDFKWLRSEMEYSRRLVPHMVAKPFIRKQPCMRISNVTRFLRRVSGNPYLRKYVMSI